MFGYYSPGVELLSITLIGSGLLPCAGQLHLTPAGQKHLSGSSVANTTTTRCSSKGGLPQKHGRVNSSGTLMLLSTHSLVT